MISSRDEKDDVELKRLCSTLFSYTCAHVRTHTHTQSQEYRLTSSKCTEEKFGVTE